MEKEVEAGTGGGSFLNNRRCEDGNGNKLNIKIYFQQKL